MAQAVGLEAWSSLASKAGGWDWGQRRETVGQVACHAQRFKVAGVLGTRCRSHPGLYCCVGDCGRSFDSI